MQEARKGRVFLCRKRSPFARLQTMGVQCVCGGHTGSGRVKVGGCVQHNPNFVTF